MGRSARPSLSVRERLRRRLDALRREADAIQQQLAQLTPHDAVAASQPGYASISAHQLQQFIEELPLTVWTVDRQFRFTCSLGGALKSLGLAQGQVVGMKLSEFFGTDDPSFPAIASHRRALAGHVVSYDLHWQDHVYQVRLRPLRDVEMRVIGCIGMALDVTQRVRNEQELKQSQQKLEQRVEQRTAEMAQAQDQLRLIRSAVEQVHEAVLITTAELDPPGPEILYVNDAFCRMSGYHPEEVIGKTPRILQGPRTDRAVLDRLRTTLQDGQVFFGRTWNYRKDGSEYLLEWHIAPIRDEYDRITNWVSIQRDITEQVAREERAQRRQSDLTHVARVSTMGEMASGLAHELNQPLAAMANYAQGALRRLQQDEADPRQISDALERIYLQADRAGMIIRRLRRFVKKRGPRRSSTDLNDLVREVAALLEPEMRRLGIHLQFDAAANLPLLLVDSIQIEQVILNLMRNAMDAMSDQTLSRRELTVRTALSASQQAVVLQVSDSGVGVSAYQLGRLFEPFFTTKTEGMGMGLPISQSIVESHGGQIEAMTNAEGGMIFQVVLPAGDGAGRNDGEDQADSTDDPHAEVEKFP